MVDLLKDEYDVAEICDTLGTPRRTHYNRIDPSPTRRRLENEALLERIEKVHEESRFTYGSPRVTAALRMEGEVVGHCRVERLMRENGIKGAMRKRARPRTTDSNHDNKASPNLLKLEGPPERPNAVWVADITYIDTSEGWWYLATVMDLHSRMVKGWAFSDRIDTVLVKDALAMAVRRHGGCENLIHHSDRGSQYTSREFRELLSACGIRCSNSAKGNCYDNAAEESLWATLKTELDIDGSMTPAAIRAKLFDYLELFYNGRRLHSGIGYRMPAELEQEFASGKPAARGGRTAGGSPFRSRAHPAHRVGSESERKGEPTSGFQTLFESDPSRRGVIDSGNSAPTAIADDSQDNLVTTFNEQEGSTNHIEKS